MKLLMLTIWFILVGFMLLGDINRKLLFYWIKEKLGGLCKWEIIMKNKKNF